MIGCPCCGMVSDPPETPAPGADCEDCGAEVPPAQLEKCAALGAVPLCVACLAKYPDDD